MTMHNHAEFKVSTDGAWILWRNLHLGTRGYAGSEYVLERVRDGKRFNFDRQRDLPVWFAQAGITFPKWREHGAYQTIIGGGRCGTAA